MSTEKSEQRIITIKKISLPKKVTSSSSSSSLKIKITSNIHPTSSSYNIHSTPIFFHILSSRSRSSKNELLYIVLEDDDEVCISSFIINLDYYPCKDFIYHHHHHEIIIQFQKNFGEVPEDIYPFYSLFSNKYQYEPIIRIIFLYMNNYELIQVMSFVNKYFLQITKKIEYGKGKGKRKGNDEWIVFKKKNWMCIKRILNEYKIWSMMIENGKGKGEGEVDFDFSCVCMVKNKMYLKKIKIVKCGKVIKESDIIRFLNELMNLEVLILKTKMIKDKDNKEEKEKEMKKNEKLKILKLLDESIVYFFKDKVISKCLNLKQLSIVHDQNNAVFIYNSLFLERKKALKYEEWSDEYEFEMSNDHLIEYFVDENGMNYMFQVKKIESGEFSLYLFQSNADCNLELTFEITCYDLETKKTYRNGLLTAKYGVGFHIFGIYDFDNKKPLKFILQK